MKRMTRARADGDRLQGYLPVDPSSVSKPRIERYRGTESGKRSSVSLIGGDLAVFSTLARLVSLVVVVGPDNYLAPWERT
jgi:hypothetical protein